MNDSVEYYHSDRKRKKIANKRKEILNFTTNKKNVRITNKYFKNKIGKEKRSSKKAKKFVDKNFIPISNKDIMMEEVIENLYLENYKKNFGRDRMYLNFIKEINDPDDVYYISDDDSDIYSDIYSYDDYDSYDDYEYRYQNYVKQQEMSEKNETLREAKNYSDIYKLNGVKTQILENTQMTSKVCCICQENMSEIRLTKCDHEYCQSCFCYYYFSLYNALYCSVCRRDMYTGYNESKIYLLK